jgi:hypothetical protein
LVPQFTPRAASTLPTTTSVSTTTSHTRPIITHNRKHFSRSLEFQQLVAIILLQCLDLSLCLSLQQRTCQRLFRKWKNSRDLNPVGMLRPHELRDRRLWTMEFKSQDSWKEAMQAVPTNTVSAKGKVPPQKGVAGKKNGKKAMHVLSL